MDDHNNKAKELVFKGKVGNPGLVVGRFISQLFGLTHSPTS
jgi:hypothetical protein